jgi:hypothetical protein
VLLSVLLSAGSTDILYCDCEETARQLAMAGMPFYVA